jgi:hypothetical protein
LFSPAPLLFCAGIHRYSPDCGEHIGAAGATRLRVAALAFGVLAGLVASLILALGGLDVAANLGTAGDRQAQAIRFGLFVVANLSVFGAALTLAAPLAGAVFLLLGAVAWVGAALLMHHSTDLVLILPPALMLVAAIFGVIAHFRRPQPVEAEEPEVEIYAPQRPQRGARRADTMGTEEAEEDEEEEEVGIPAFAAEQRSEPSVRGTFDDDRGRPQNAEWNPRKRQPPPPRAKPAFRPIEEEYEDDEPSGFSRFALGLSGILSFGLYAALAGAAVLIFWSVRNDAAAPAVTVADAPAVSSSAEPAPSSASSSEPNRLPSTTETLTPILGGEPIREVATSGTAPSTTPSELVAETATSQEPGTFGAVSLPDGPVTIPALSDDFTNEPDSTPLPPVSAAPPSLPQDDPSSEEPAPLDLEAAQPEPPSVAPPGQALPRSVPLRMAAMRAAAGTGPTAVATPPTNSNTGL